MITVKEVRSKKDLKSFVKYPFKLYQNCEFWVPPIISQELKTFNKNENPVFNDAEARFFLAIKNNQIVGRIAVIVNWLEVNNNNEKKIRFGWFDFDDDLEISKALLNKVNEIGKELKMEYCEGPVGFSNMDKVGVVTEGFDSKNTMITWYNYPYYQLHYESHGFKEEKSYIESRFPFSNVSKESFAKAQTLIKKRYNLKAIGFNRSKDIMPYVDKMFDLFNKSYSSLSSFVEITDIQKEYFKKKFISFVNPEYVKFVLDKNDELIAFAIVMPSFAKELQEMNGKLFPFGFLKLLKAKKHSKDVVFYLIGVDPEYQNKGVTAVIFNEYYDVFEEKGILNCYRTPELEDNEAIHKIWKHFNPEIYKRRKTYRKSIQ